MKQKMKLLRKRYVPTIMVPALLALLFASVQAHAIPVQGTILSGGNFSVVHTGATPGGSGDPNGWMWFDPGQAIVMDLNGNDLSLLGPQTFTLQDGNGLMSSILITALNLDFNDPADGFLGGTLSYVFDETPGTFTFLNENYNSIFNTSTFDGTNLDFYVWGGDAQRNLGIDLGVSGLVSVISNGNVPVPGTFLLLALGLLGLRRHIAS